MHLMATCKQPIETRSLAGKQSLCCLTLCEGQCVAAMAVHSCACLTTHSTAVPPLPTLPNSCHFKGFDKTQWYMGLSLCWRCVYSFLLRIQHTRQRFHSCSESRHQNRCVQERNWPCSCSHSGFPEVAMMLLFVTWVVGIIFVFYAQFCVLFRTWSIFLSVVL